MKKSLLIALCLLVTITNYAVASDIQNAPTNAEVKQKACQNVFSLINIDLSVMSPRAAVSDVIVSEPKAGDAKRGEIVPITNKSEQTQTTIPKNKTSLFRLDLLHIFKIQVF